MDNNQIYHYGVLGMKWGVKRSQRKLASIDKKAEKRGWSDDVKTVAKIKTKKIDQMSNSELKKLNERVRLEKEYANLNKKQTGAGRKFINEVVRETAKNTATSYTTKYAKRGVDWFIDRMKQPV